MAHDVAYRSIHNHRVHLAVSHRPNANAQSRRFGPGTAV
jgi:hypothetical protein